MAVSLPWAFHTDDVRHWCWIGNRYFDVFTTVMQFIWSIMSQPFTINNHRCCCCYRFSSQWMEHATECGAKITPIMTIPIKIVSNENERTLSRIRTVHTFVLFCSLLNFYMANKFLFIVGYFEDSKSAYSCTVFFLSVCPEYIHSIFAGHLPVIIASREKKQQQQKN